MNIRKRTKAAVLAAAVTAATLLTGTPAQAASYSCAVVHYTTATQRVYNMSLSSRPPAGSRYYFHAYWGAVSHAEYNSTVLPIRTRKHTGAVYKVTGRMVVGGRIYTCRTWFDNS